MELSKLTAEAFGPGRLEILKLLLGQPLRYSDLVRRLELSEGEVSRHLQRLHAAGLVDKQATGGFLLTPLARTVLRFQTGLGLAAEHSEYFRTHDVHALGERHLLRVDDLGFAEFLNDPFEMMEGAHGVFRSVRERFDGICLPAAHIAEGHPSTHLVALRDAAKEHGTKVRLVLQDEEVVLGVQLHDPVSPRVEYRSVPVSRVDLAVSDEAAALAFAQRDGRMDYNAGFFERDPRFVGFCRDYFEFVWASARPVDPKARSAALATPIKPLWEGMKGWKRPP